MSNTGRRLLSGVSTNVIVLGVVSMLTDASSEMIYSVLPLFLKGIGTTVLVIGLIEGAGESIASLLKVFSGRYSDRWGKRKPFILGGYGGSALVKPFLVFATSPWHVLGVRAVERTGKGVRSAPRDALIADCTDQGSMGKSFGFHKSMDSAGAVIGVVAALVILALTASMDALDAYRLVFLIAIMPAFAAVAVIVLFVKEKQGCARAPRGSFLKDMSKLGREFWLLMAVVVTFYAGEISYVFFLLQGQAEGLSDTTNIGLYLMFNIVFVIVAIPSGTLSDRLGRRPLILSSFLVFALTCVAMAVAGGLLILAAGFVMFGLYKGMSEGVLKAYVVDVVPKDLRGTALGAFHTSVGLVMLPGGVVAGFLWDSFGPWATFTFGACAAVAASLMLVTTGRSRPA